MSAEVFGFGKNLGFELLLGPGKPAFPNRPFNFGVVKRGNGRECGKTKQDYGGKAAQKPGGS